LTEDVLFSCCPGAAPEMLIIIIIVITVITIVGVVAFALELALQTGQASLQ
jgi:hypothetical protein